jgi:hypothetical protein
VTHIYACVKQNNERAYVKERYNPDLQPAGDHDCKLGVKRSTKEEKEYLWGYSFPRRGPF